MTRQEYFDALRNLGPRANNDEIKRLYNEFETSQQAILEEMLNDGSFEFLNVARDIGVPDWMLAPFANDFGILQALALVGGVIAAARLYVFFKRRGLEFAGDERMATVVFAGGLIVIVLLGVLL